MEANKKNTHRHFKAYRGTRAGKSVRECKEKVKDKHQNVVLDSTKDYKKVEETSVHLNEAHQQKDTRKFTMVELSRDSSMDSNSTKNIQQNTNPKVTIEKNVASTYFKPRSELSKQVQQSPSNLQYKKKYRGTRAGKVVKRTASMNIISEFLWSLVKNSPYD